LIDNAQHGSLDIGIEHGRNLMLLVLALHSRKDRTNHGLVPENIIMK
jgi:hypothetical protein